MELNDKEAAIVKATYSDYHAGALSADEALYVLELIINGS
jgi:hypothetical protein